LHIKGGCKSWGGKGVWGRLTFKRPVKKKMGRGPDAKMKGRPSIIKKEKKGR